MMCIIILSVNYVLLFVFRGRATYKYIETAFFLLE